MTQKISTTVKSPVLSGSQRRQTNKEVITNYRKNKELDETSRTRNFMSKSAILGLADSVRELEKDIAKSGGVKMLSNCH